MTTTGTGAGSRSLILTAMIFAVAMTFIDQTIVSIAAPTIQHDLGLTSSGNIAAIPQFIRADFAATRDVLYGMTIVMAVAAIVALRGLRRGVQQEPEQAGAPVGAALPVRDG
jgi:MFS family permease